MWLWIKARASPVKDGVLRWRRVDLQAAVDEKFAVRQHERMIGTYQAHMAFAAFLSAQSPPKLTPQHSMLSIFFTRLAADILPEYSKRKPLEVWVQDEAHGGRQWMPTPKWARR